MIKALLSLPYQLVHALRSSLYAAGILKAKSLDARVISIGNYSFGGTGKSPFTIELVKALVKQGKKVAILTRGYGADPKFCSKHPIITSNMRGFINSHIQGLQNEDERNEGRLESYPDNSLREPPGVEQEKDYQSFLQSPWNQKISPSNIGDEPHMMLQEFKSLNSEVFIVIDANRYRGGQALLAAGYKVDTFVLDDGMQHLQLHRDVEVLLINANESGFSREFRSSAVAKADFIVQTKVNAEFQLENPGQNSVSSKIYLSNELDPSKSTLAFTGIADPQSFFKILDAHLKDLDEANCSKLSEGLHLRAFPDHHKFSKKEVMEIISAGTNLVCTPKDFYKIPMEYRGQVTKAELVLEAQPIDLFDEIAKEG